MILSFFCLLAIHELGREDKGNSESTQVKKFQPEFHFDLLTYMQENEFLGHLRVKINNQGPPGTTRAKPKY